MNLRDHLDKVYKDLEFANNTYNAVLDLEKISDVFRWIDDALRIIRDKEVDFATIVESQDYDDYQNKMRIFFLENVLKNLNQSKLKEETLKWEHDYILQEWEYDLLREI